MTLNELEKVMVKALNFFNTTGTAATKTTVLGTILSTEDGFGTATSARLYKGMIRAVLANEGHEDKAWPSPTSKWLQMDVKTLAPKLL